VRWNEQALSGSGDFKVFKFETFSGASTASVLVTADAIEGFDHVDIWMRHGAIPTVLDHLVHTVLKKNEKQASLHVQQPLQGVWYVALAGSFAEKPRTSIQDTQKVFVKEEGRAVLTLDARTSGCERGRFGWPACEENWMRLSWGKDAKFEGLLPVGSDPWTCSMYEVAPFTAQVDLTLLNPPKVSGQPSTPQIYARRHAYPSVTAYDITTAVNGDSWTPTISLHLPKEGTWYVCVHAQKLLTPAPVAVSVAAQVLPHTECVSRTIVAKDGSNAKRVTHCTDEVVKLAVRFDGDASAVSAPGLLSSSNPAGAGAISLPAFVPPNSGKHLHLTGGSIRYFSFTLDPSLAGFALRIQLHAFSKSGAADAFLRRAALPETETFDLRETMQKGVIDWTVRFPEAGEWYLGIFSATSIQFSMHISLGACPHSCSHGGQCALRYQTGGIVVGVCECEWGLMGDDCSQRTPLASSPPRYYLALFLALLAPLLAIPPAMLALGQGLPAVSALLLLASAAALTHQLSTISSLSALTAPGSLAATDTAVAVAGAVAAAAAAAQLRPRLAGAIEVLSVTIALLLASWAPVLTRSPILSLLPGIAAPLALILAAVDGSPALSGEFTPSKRLRALWIVAGIIASVLAFFAARRISNENFVADHAVCDSLLYLCATAFLLSRGREPDSERDDGPAYHSGAGEDARLIPDRGSDARPTRPAYSGAAFDPYEEAPYNAGGRNDEYDEFGVDPYKNL